MKIYKFFIIIIIFVTININSNVHANEYLNEKVDFIFLGHLYPILNDKVLLEKIILKINNLKPKYVFFLGDSNLENQKIIDFFKNSIKSQVYFTPGNQEYINIKNKKHNKFFENQLVTFDNINFILLDSNQSSKDINEYLKKIYLLIDKSFINIILTHHRIWDDTILSENSYMHDKSFLFKDLLTNLEKLNIKYIFAGNSKRQYFRDFDYKPHYGKININNIYWVDKINNIVFYSIGMGDGYPKATFVSAQIIDNKLFVNPEYVSNYTTKEILTLEFDYLNKITLNDIIFYITNLIYYRINFLLISLLIFLLIIIFIFVKKIKK